MSSFAVIFDMDGVLVNTIPHHLKIFKLFFAKHKIKMKKEDFIRCNGRTNKDILTYFFEPVSKKRVSQLAEEKEALFRRATRGLKPVKGLKVFLDVLRRKKIKVAIATSAPPKNVDFILKQAGIRQYFDTILDDTSVLRGKPDPAVYLRTAEFIKYKPKRCLVFEDALNGICSARATGMKVIGVATVHKKEDLKEANYVIKNFTQISVKKLEEIMNEKVSEV